MTPVEFAGYVMMIIRANRENGVWWGSARALSFTFNSGMSDRTARRVLEELEAGGYLKRFAKPGAHGNYAILINRYECTDGARKGMRVDALKTTDWKNPAVFGPQITQRAEIAETEGIKPEKPGQDVPALSRPQSKQSAKSAERTSKRPELFIPCIQHARETWAEKFNTKPSWGAKDDAQLARILRRHGDLTLGEFKARWGRYLDDDDRFTARMGYSLAWFCSRFDTYAEAMAGGIPEVESPY